MPPGPRAAHSSNGLLEWLLLQLYKLEEGFGASRFGMVTISIIQKLISRTCARCGVCYMEGQR